MWVQFRSQLWLTLNATVLLFTSLASATCVNYTVTMSDSYGDGWSGNILYVGTFSFTLSGGYSTSTACLDPGTTYTPYACGGYEDSKVFWSVGGVSGGADDTCSGLESFTVPPVPTLAPTHAPTLITGVTTISEFNAAASTSNSVVRLAADLTSFSSDGLMISDVTNVVVDGAGKMIMGQANLYTTAGGFYSYEYVFGIDNSKVTVNDMILNGRGFSGIRAYDSTVVLNRISFHNCSQYSAIKVFRSFTELTDILFQDNLGTSFTMYVEDGKSLVLKRVYFTSNTSPLHVISSVGNQSAPVLLTSLIFALNSRGFRLTDSTATLRYVQFEDNQDYVMQMHGTSSVKLDTVSFARNTGSIFYSDSSAAIIMTAVTFTANQANTAAMFVTQGNARASNLMFYGNSPLDLLNYDASNLECTVDACSHGTTEAATRGSECTSCSPCDALRVGLVTMCSSCDAGLYSYKNASLHASCMDCGGGNRSLSGMNSSCTLMECPAGSYGSLDSSACEICQNGYATYTAGLTVCSRCEFLEWCPTNGLCIEGHTGVGCAECESNWYMKSNMCQQCPENAGGTLALAFVVAAFLLYALYTLAGAEEDDGIQSKVEDEAISMTSTAVAKFNVSLSFFQITTTLLFSFQLEFPVDLLNWLSWIAFPLSINFGELGRPECSLETSMGFASRWYINTFAPIILMVPFFVLARCRLDCRNQAFATIALIGTTTYVPVVGSAVSVWRCEDTDYGDTVLAVAPSVSCDGSGYYYGILAGSIGISAMYFSCVHALVPFLAKLEGFRKVKRIYVQDFDKGKKWWFHVSLIYKLATLLVAAVVANARLQLSLMLFFSLAMTLLSFIFRPHITTDSMKKKYWNEKCTQGCRSIWAKLYDDVDLQSSKFLRNSLFTLIVLIPTLSLLLYFTLGGNLLDTLLAALLSFLWGIACFLVICFYPFVSDDGGFTPNAIETGFHFLETVLVLFAFLYELKSKKLEHPKKELVNDDIAYDDEHYDNNGDYKSSDARLLEFGISFVYLVGFIAFVFEVMGALISDPWKHVKDWCTEKAADDPVIDRCRQIFGIFEKHDDTKAGDSATRLSNPVQSAANGTSKEKGPADESDFSHPDNFEVELVESVNLKGTTI